MKSKILLTLGAILSLGVLVSSAWVGVTHAADIRSGDKTTLRADEITDNTLYTAGNTVMVAGTVKGDLFCAGNNIDITGTVEGDVICAGQNLRIGGKVLGDVRVAGQNIDVNGTVGGSLTTAGQVILIGKDASIGRDVTLAGSSTRIEGHVGRDILGSASDLIITGRIDRHVNVQATSISLNTGAKIGGNFDYRAAAEASVDQDAMVLGETHFTQQEQRSTNDILRAKVSGVIYSFVSILLVGLAALLIAPRVMDATGATLRHRIAASFSAGAVALLVTPVLAMILFMSLVGIPLAFVLMLSWIVCLILSVIVTPYAVGWVVVERFLKWPPRGRRLASLTIGLLIMVLAGLIPLIGVVIVFLCIIFGLGALVLNIRNRLFPLTLKTAKDTSKKEKKNE